MKNKLYNLHHTLYLFCPCEYSLNILENISGLMKNLKNVVKKKIDEKILSKNILKNITKNIYAKLLLKDIVKKYCRRNIIKTISLKKISSSDNKYRQRNKVE